MKTFLRVVIFIPLERFLKKDKGEAHVQLILAIEWPGSTGGKERRHLNASKFIY